MLIAFGKYSDAVMNVFVHMSERSRITGPGTLFP